MIGVLKLKGLHIKSAHSQIKKYNRYRKTIFQIKMASEFNAENVFGQVLICLRMSKLDFLIKETHNAAIITVKKKFQKSVNFDEDIIFVGNKEAYIYGL